MIHAEWLNFNANESRTKFDGKSLRAKGKELFSRFRSRNRDIGTNTHPAKPTPAPRGNPPAYSITYLKKAKEKGTLDQFSSNFLP